MTFKLMDKDGSGKMSKNELKAILKDDPEFSKRNEEFWD